MMVRLDVLQRLVECGVVLRGDQRVLQTVTLRPVVVHIVGRYERRTELAGQSHELAVAFQVAAQEVLL